ncbi:MAG: hypothetical protein HUJ31_17970, partial [Pseudomonadales bacterium]|nr:hypothetical protein [Pseudomonadales bacterium]
FEEADLAEIIGRTREMNDKRKATLERGRDRLLELNSHRRDVSRQLIGEIGEFEGGKQLEAYMERSFDMWGLESEPLDDHVQVVKPTERMVRHDAVSIETMDRYHYPELPEDGIRITYDRDTALSREDVAFFTWESPLVRQALDLVTSSITGNSTMVAIKHPHLPSGTLLLETLHVIECIAPAELMTDRYLPPKVLRSVVTPNLENVSRSFPWQDLEEEQLEVPDSTLHKIIDSQLNGLRQMLEVAGEEAGRQLEQLREGARKKMARSLNAEIRRMEALHEVNPLVRPEELEHLKLTRQALETAIDQADVRLDAIRVIVAA